MTFRGKTMIPSTRRTKTENKIMNIAVGIFCIAGLLVACSLIAMGVFYGCFKEGPEKITYKVIHLTDEGDTLGVYNAEYVYMSHKKTRLILENGENVYLKGGIIKSGGRIRND